MNLFPQEIAEDRGLIFMRFPVVWFTLTASLDALISGSQVLHNAMTFPDSADLVIPNNRANYARLRFVRTCAIFAKNNVNSQNVMVESTAGALQFGRDGAEQIRIDGVGYTDSTLFDIWSGESSGRVWRVDNLSKISMRTISTRQVVNLAALQTTPVCSFSGADNATSFISIQPIVTLSDKLSLLID